MPAVVRPQAGHRLVDRDHTEELVLRAQEWHEQRVLGMPRARILGDGKVGRVDGTVRRGPVEVALPDRVRSGVREALVEQPVPRLARVETAEQRLLRGGVPVHGDHLEVVPGGTVEVDRHGAEPGRLADRARDLAEGRREVAARASEMVDLEQAAIGRPCVVRPSAVATHPTVFRHFGAWSLGLLSTPLRSAGC
jgi:hypothetical protein